MLALFQDSTNVERKRLYAERTRRAQQIRRDLRAHRTPPVHLLLFFVHPSHQAGRGDGMESRTKSCIHRTVDDQFGRDRRRPRLYRSTRGTAYSSGRDEEFRSRESLRADQRHAGRADVRTLARRGGQSQAREDRERRHGRSFVAHHPGQRENHLPDDRSPVSARSACHLRRRHFAADSRQRSRQPGRAEADHQPGEAQIFHTRARRIPAAEVARRTGWIDARLGRQRNSDRKRRRAGVRRTWARARRAA